ncbi:putative exonuclease modulated with PAS domain [Desulfobacula toluolica Tol2]|uniref:Putative exonuclease modulated with PAS domain n=2 Tax=Desulfobacula toluolica TaxID=28223 RepID=K0NMQ4_DESTT|nr:putative exonuclease modulated with PAS domain [Desulfobacula toluolica Tol2]
MSLDKMKQTNRFWKFVFFALAATLVVITAILSLLWQALSREEGRILISLANDYFLYIISAVFICIAVAFAGLEIIFITYIKPLKKICDEASMIYSSNPSHRITINGNKDIKALSYVINSFADLFENLNKNITEQILAARKKTEEERNLLAAIMAELPQGVFICNKCGRILLFNSLAKKIFSQESKSLKAEYFIGLGRSIFHLIDKELIGHAIEEIQTRLKNEQKSVASYFITPIHTGHLISVETIPILDQKKEMTGFILTFQDVSDDINTYDITHKTLVTLKKELSKHILLVKEELIQSYDKNRMNSSGRLPLIKILDQLPRHHERVSDIVLDAILTKVPLTKLLLSDFLNSMKSKADSQYGIKLNIIHQTENNRIQADKYLFTTALILLFKNLSDIILNNEFNIASLKTGNRIIFEITWQNRLSNKNQINKNQVEKLLYKRFNELPSLFYILKLNKAQLRIICDSFDFCSQINIITRAEFKTPLREKLRPPVIAGSRPEFYDFNLFKTEDENLDLLDTNLRTITYTVFDTETTGLNPDGGDEIISIAAVRIVNLRIAYQDIFEELVDPKRDIPMESYKIHGINYEMVNGKKDIRTILPIFKQFTSNTVIVGHNIAFDMKMLKVKEKTTQIKFSNPVLDTLLLSAILHPVHERHDMENIAKRLGVNIIGRHTALGDAIATAEIFLKLLPILNSNGILTLKDAIKASKKSYYARLKY